MDDLKIQMPDLEAKEVERLAKDAKASGFFELGPSHTAIHFWRTSMAKRPISERRQEIADKVDDLNRVALF